MDHRSFASFVEAVRIQGLTSIQRAHLKVVLDRARGDLTPGSNVLCHYCGAAPGVTRDHIVPRAMGGSDGKWNIVPACQPCNVQKADRFPTCDCFKCTGAIERWRRTFSVPSEEVL